MKNSPRKSENTLGTAEVSRQFRVGPMIKILLLTTSLLIGACVKGNSENPGNGNNPGKGDPSAETTGSGSSGEKSPEKAPKMVSFTFDPQSETLHIDSLILQRDKSENLDVYDFTFPEGMPLEMNGYKISSVSIIRPSSHNLGWRLSTHANLAPEKCSNTGTMFSDLYDLELKNGQLVLAIDSNIFREREEQRDTASGTGNDDEFCSELKKEEAAASRRMDDMENERLQRAEQ